MDADKHLRPHLRGRAIIVSIEKWKGRLRPRAVVDREKMEKLLTMLNFRVTVLVDKNAEALRTEFKNIINNIGGERSDCFVCFVSAYGSTEEDDRQFILDHGGAKLYVVDDIIKPFMACKRLDKTPKVFFINMCIGDFDMHGFNSGAGKPSAISRISNDRSRSLRLDVKDLLAVFSIEEEYQAAQDLGCFIPALLNSLDQNHNNKDVVQIVNDANGCQMISVINTLEIKLFWRTRMLKVEPGAQILFLFVVCHCLAYMIFCN